MVKLRLYDYMIDDMEKDGQGFYHDNIELAINDFNNNNDSADITISFAYRYHWKRFGKLELTKAEGKILYDKLSSTIM